MGRQKPPKYDGPKRIVGFKLTLDTIHSLKAEANEAGCWPNRIVEQALREHLAQKRRQEAIAS